MTAPIPTNRDQALAEIIRLMETNQITLADLKGFEREDQGDYITRILSYTGAVLVLAGLGFFLSMQWASLVSFLRVALTFGPGLIALVMAIVSLKNDAGYAHLATPLFTLAAFFQTGGLFVFLEEYADGDNTTMAVLMVMGFMAAQFTTLFFALRRPVTLFFALVFAHCAFAALFDVMDIRERYAAVTLGLSGLLISYALARSSLSSITGVGFIISGYSFASGWFTIAKDSPMDITLIAVAAGLMYASVLSRSRTLLFVAVTTMLGYLGYYTDEYFKNIVGWPIALIVFGLVMIIGSNYAIRLGRQFKPT